MRNAIFAAFALAAAALAGASVGLDGAAADRTPEQPGSTALPVADQVVVHKGERRLYLLRDGQVLRSYHIALGLRPQGSKERSGDFRTPEGSYRLTRRNPHSNYFLSILVSYPNAGDLQRARARHSQAGGLIMIHGLPNELRHPVDYYESTDWTDGCIALSDADMMEVWLLTPDNIPIEIEP